jgi:hypothetical protein
VKQAIDSAGAINVIAAEEVEAICSRALSGSAPQTSEIEQLLCLPGPAAAAPLFAAAREA